MAQRICPDCGYEGTGKKQLRGSKTTEVLIWTLLVIPGPLYSLWRRAGAPQRCPNCGRGHMVSPTSAEGQLALKRYEVEFSTLKAKASSSASPVPKSSSSNASGVSLTDNSPRTARPTTKRPIDPDAW